MTKAVVVGVILAFLLFTPTGLTISGVVLLGSLEFVGQFSPTYAANQAAKAAQEKAMDKARTDARAVELEAGKWSTKKSAEWVKDCLAKDSDRHSICMSFASLPFLPPPDVREAAKKAYDNCQAVRINCKELVWLLPQP